MATAQAAQRPKGLNRRALCALTLLCAAPVTALTGLWLSQLTEPSPLRHAHIGIGLVFTISAIWHATYNTKPLSNYLRPREGGYGLRREAWLAMAIAVVALLAGWHTGPGR